MAGAKGNLPDFENRPGYPHRILPDGVYLCDEDTFETRFATEFSQSTTRQEICEGFFRMRSASVAHGISALQWVDGSFVEDKVNPNDVDVVTFVNFDLLNDMSPEARSFVYDVLSGREFTKVKYCTHAFFSAACLPTHVYYPVFEKQRAYWRKWMGETYNKFNRGGDNQERHRKGFVAIPLGEEHMVPDVSAERSN